MKKLMLLALVAMPAALSAVNFEELMNHPELPAKPAAKKFSYEARDKRDERAAANLADAADNVEAEAIPAEPANYGSEAKPVKKMGFLGRAKAKVSNARQAHPYAFFGILAVTGAGIFGWIANKVIAYRKAKKAEVVVAPEIQAQQALEAQITASKPAVKKA